MKVLVISDILHKLVSGEEIEFIKWDEDRALSLRGYDCLLIDMSFEKEKRQSAEIQLLYELKKHFEKPNFLSKNNLISVIVCGTKEEPLSVDEVYDPTAENKTYEHIVFSNYDFLKAVTPGNERIEFDEGEHVYSLAYIPVSLYLQRYKNGPTYLSYDYEQDHEDCVDITPLAKMKERGRACVAFECRNGRGMAVILPAYDKVSDDKKTALKLLLRICKNYYKKSEGINELIKEYVDDVVPMEVRDAFIEALICYSYDLFASSLLMCRRALETSAIIQGATGKEFLGIKITELFEKKLIDENLHDVAREVIEFGNWMAHPNKYRGKNVSEEDVKNVIAFLQIYFDYVYCIPDKLEKSKKRRIELEKEEK